MTKLQMLKSLSFGARVAEEETSELASYFVETDQWTRIVRGEIDVIRGDKGAGKSAIYSLLMSRTDDFFDRRILLVAAEKPRGATVFKDLVADPPTTEIEFVGMWKLYILTVLAERLRDYGISGDDAQAVFSALEGAGLLKRGSDLSSILRRVRDYARKLIALEAVEGGVSLDPLSGAPSGLTGKITFREPSSAMRTSGFASVDNLLGLANNALGQADYNMWVLLDRLDVAFADSHELEANALRALFRVYLDLMEHEHIGLKIFLRSDIWNRITQGGFRESSHITRYVTLEWSQASLLNLMVRRLLKNDALVASFGIDRERVLGDFDAQQEIFYRFFPRQVEQGPRKSHTLYWMVSRCADGKSNTAPRELIHLLTSLREQEIARLERGEAPAEVDQIFDRSVFKLALPAVSEARLVQNFYAEYPDYKSRLENLRGEKTEQTPESLARIWGTSNESALQLAQELVDLGFFQSRGARAAPTFWVPFLYRDALQMSQGLAEED